MGAATCSPCWHAGYWAADLQRFVRPPFTGTRAPGIALSVRSAVRSSVRETVRTRPSSSATTGSAATFDWRRARSPCWTGLPRTTARWWAIGGTVRRSFRTTSSSSRIPDPDAVSRSANSRRCDPRNHLPKRDPLLLEAQPRMQPVRSKIVIELGLRLREPAECRPDRLGLGAPVLAMGEQGLKAKDSARSIKPGAKRAAV